MPRIKVVVADDHAVVCEGYRRLFELQDDMEVAETFPTGEAAYQWLTANSADVLILDISMPGRGGLETLKRLHYRLPQLRILIFSMHDSESLAAHTLHLGAHRYINKACAPQELIDAVRELGSLDISAAHEPSIESRERLRLSPHLLLAPREFDVFLLLAEGMSVDAIAANRGLSKKTVANYQTSIRNKTGCTNPVEIHRYALRFHLISAGAAAQSVPNE